MKSKDKKETISLIQTVIKSCEEGRDGTWDCSTDEGKEGFNDMKSLLEDAMSLINKTK